SRNDRRYPYPGMIPRYEGNRKRQRRTTCVERRRMYPCAPPWQGRHGWVGPVRLARSSTTSAQPLGGGGAGGRGDPEPLRQPPVTARGDLPRLRDPPVTQMRYHRLIHLKGSSAALHTSERCGQGRAHHNASHFDIATNENVLHVVAKVGHGGER